MIRIAVLGDIGSGKSYVAKQFDYPVFNADTEVAKLYRKSRKCYNKLKKTLPGYIVSFPVKKIEISKAIIADQHNLKKIIKIVQRIRKLGTMIADQLNLNKEKVEISASICKADLLSDLVGEYPELQGILGSYFANAQVLSWIALKFSRN